MDACAPRRGPSCCPCVSFGFDLASMASGDAAIVRCHVETQLWSQNPICQAKKFLRSAAKSGGYAAEQATLTPVSAALGPHAIDAQREAGLVPRASALVCSDRRKERTPRRRKSRTPPPRGIKHASSQRSPSCAVTTGKKQRQHHRRVGKKKQRCSRRASSTPRARCGGGGGAACRATGGSCLLYTSPSPRDRG